MKIEELKSGLKVLIYIEGGLVQEIITNNNQITVDVIDKDNEDGGDERFIDFKYPTVVDVTLMDELIHGGEL